jgi:hypothetical protein
MKNGLPCCGHARDRHDVDGCRTWFPGTALSAPRRCNCTTPTPEQSNAPSRRETPVETIHADLHDDLSRRRRRRDE